MLPYYTDYLERLKVLLKHFRYAIRGLSPEQLDWTPGPQMNSLCVLVVHTTGSARFWIGDVAGGKPSNRNRDAEFQARGLTEADLCQRMDNLYAFAESLLATFTLDDLAAPRRDPNPDDGRTAGWALLHALEHTGLHMGQAQITRQLLDGQTEPD
jgi:uncharacterized damage-inducible protein DinB